MYKNEEIEIRPMQNGYKVSYEFRELNPTPDNPRNWDYTSEDYLFKTWDEVVDFVKGKELEVPPAKL